MMTELEECITVSYKQRRSFWDWAHANGIQVENWGINLATARDIWHIGNEQARAWAALKWS